MNKRIKVMVGKIATLLDLIDNDSNHSIIAQIRGLLFEIINL